MANTNDILRKMPFSLEAEQSLLGSILIDPEKINDISSIVTSMDFYLDEHQAIFSAMQKLAMQSRDIDPVILMDMLVQEDVYDIEQSKKYIRTIAEIVPSSSNIKDYAKIVKDKSLLRQLIDTCSEITDTAYAEQDEVEKIVDSAEAKIFALAQTKESRDFVKISDVLMETYKNIKERATNPDAAIGTPSGFADLDKLIVGFGEGDLVIVGARPGMGKTAFALNMATNIARSSRKAVCIFSLEMSSEQLVQRMLASEALVDSTSLRNGNLTSDDWTKLAKASSFLSEYDIYIDDTTGISITGMKSKLRRVKNLGLVVVDYLQLMQSDRKIDNRVQEVSEISRNLKLLAKELNVPVICCAQLSRTNEARKDRRPMLSDLRDSGAIEQDADMVVFLYRDEYYEKEQESNVAEVIVEKNRHGGRGNVKLNWFGQYTRFSSMTNLEEPR